MYLIKHWKNSIISFWFIGGLNIPKFPNLPGREVFQGESFHGNQWNHDFDWTGKRVGVIGTGCSAVQIVPTIAPGCKDLYVFQRTPSWIAPKADMPYPGFVQRAFHMFPILMKIHRWYFFFRQELFFQVKTDSSLFYHVFNFFVFD